MICPLVLSASQPGQFVMPGCGKFSLKELKSVRQAGHGGLFNFWGLVPLPNQRIRQRFQQQPGWKLFSESVAEHHL